MPDDVNPSTPYDAVDPVDAPVIADDDPTIQDAAAPMISDADAPSRC